MLLGLSCMGAAMFFKNIYRRSKWEANRNLGFQEGIHASGVAWRPKCFSGVWRHQCSKMYDGSNVLQKYIHVFSKVYFPKLYFCEVYPTCVSSKLCEFISLLKKVIFFSEDDISIGLST